MNTTTGSFLLALLIVVALTGWTAPGQAMIVTELDITGGSVKYGGQFQQMLNRLVDEDGVVKMGQYQPMGSIEPSITRGGRTFSLFTSGMQGAPVPSAAIDGSSIRVDLSSLFFGISQGDYVQAWHIGGQAVGTFDPKTSHFTLSWNEPVPSTLHSRQSDPLSSWARVLGDGWGVERSVPPFSFGAAQQRHGHPREATFILEGTAMVGGSPTPVPVPASVVLYATGLLGLGAWVWLKQRRIGIA